MSFPAYIHEIVDLSCAAITLFFSGLVILTGILFPTMMRRSHFMRLIVTISVCDFLGSAFLVVGFPRNGPYCEWQGFSWFFFSRGSWFFTAALGCQLYFLLIRGKLLISEKMVHVICWLSNIILGVVVFGGDVSYGVDSYRAGTKWCELVSNDNEKNAYTYDLVLFVVPVIITTFLLIIINTTALFQYYILQSIKKSDRHQSLLRTMLLYPSCMVVAWLPNIITFFIGTYSSGDDDGFPWQLTIFVDYLSNGWGVLYGAFLAIVFFMNSSEAKRRWYTFMAGYFHAKSDSLLFAEGESSVIINDSDVLEVDDSDAGSSPVGLFMLTQNRNSLTLTHDTKKSTIAVQDNPLSENDFGLRSSAATVNTI